MTVLVINSGSTSIKIAAIDDRQRLFQLKIERLGGSQPGSVDWGDGREPEPCQSDHASALAGVLPEMVDRLAGRNLVAIGHRVVHGGVKFPSATVIDQDVERKIDAPREHLPPVKARRSGRGRSFFG